MTYERAQRPQQMEASPERLRQARQQLGLGAAFKIIEATQVLDLYTSFGVVQVQLPAGEFLLVMQDPAVIRRYGLVRFEGIPDDEGWHVGWHVD